MTAQLHSASIVASKPGPDSKNMEQVWIFFQQANIGMIEEWK